MKTMSDRAKAFLNQFENPSQCPDPRGFGLDSSNQYYNLLYSASYVIGGAILCDLLTRRVTL